MSKRNRKKNWNLYVLRYDYSANYYVGTNQDLKRRMGEHWKRTSTNQNLPKWSEKNHSTKGFRFYWFKVNESGVSKKSADHCENCLAHKLVDQIKILPVDIYVGSNKIFGREETPIDEFEVIENKDNSINIDNEIDELFINLNVLTCPKIKEDFSIKCYAIGHIGEYDEKRQYNKKFEKIADFEYLAENE